MKQRDRNRLAAFQASLSVLNQPEYKPLWFDQPPKIFTRLVAEAAAAVAALEASCQAQATDITGVAADKEREERELEDVCILYGGTVALFFRLQSDETSAAKVDLTPTEWRRLPEQDLIASSRVLIELMNRILTEATPAEAEEWGVTPAAIETVQQESDDLAAALADPQSAIAQRKATTASLRVQFRAVAEQFEILDRLMGHFTTTPAGAALAATYQNARNIIDRGHRLKPTNPNPEAPTDEPILP